MILNIAICDSNSNDCKSLEYMLNVYCLNNNISSKIALFSSGNDFLASLEHTRYDIVYMDTCVDENGNNGIDTIRTAKFRHKSHNSQVIFSSNNKEHAVDAFNLNATHYLVKPLSSNDALESIKRCLSNIKSIKAATALLNVKTNTGVITIPIEDIVYIEVDNKVCQIHTTKNTIETHSSLNSMKDKLDDYYFLKINRSFLINMNFIKLYHFDHITMNDGKVFSISRNNRDKMREEYMYFLLDKTLASEN